MAQTGTPASRPRAGSASLTLRSASTGRPRRFARSPSAPDGRQDSTTGPVSLKSRGVGRRSVPDRVPGSRAGCGLSSLHDTGELEGYFRLCAGAGSTGVGPVPSGVLRWRVHRRGCARNVNSVTAFKCSTAGGEPAKLLTRTSILAVATLIGPLGCTSLQVKSDTKSALIHSVQCHTFGFAGSFRDNSPLRGTIANPGAALAGAASHAKPPPPLPPRVIPSMGSLKFGHHPSYDRFLR